jgi:hypothetical protein
MRSIVLSLCVVSAVQVVALAPARAEDKEEQAKRYFLEAKQAYLEGRYHAAVASFRAAAAIRPSPILDFNIGRCFEKLGKLDEAIAAYEKYLKTAKDAPNRADVQTRVVKLKEERKRQRTKDPYEDLEKGAGTAKAPVVAPVPVLAPASRPAAASRPYAAPPPGRVRDEAAGPVHEASQSSSWGSSAAPAPVAPSTAAPAAPLAPRAPAPMPAPQHRDTTPVYKTWWFWVACAAGAGLAALFITTAVYAGGGGSSHSSHALQVRF